MVPETKTLTGKTPPSGFELTTQWYVIDYGNNGLGEVVKILIKIDQVFIVNKLNL